MSTFGYILIETSVESMKVGVQHGQIASLLSVFKLFCLKLHQHTIIVLNAKTCKGKDTEYRLRVTFPYKVTLFKKIALYNWPVNSSSLFKTEARQVIYFKGQLLCSVRESSLTNGYRKHNLEI